MGRGSAARRQGNVGRGQRRAMISRGAPRRPLPARPQPTPVDDEGSEHESAEAERRQPTSIDEEGSEHESDEAERRQSIPTDEEGSNHGSAEAERRQPTSIDEEGSDHNPAEAEGDNDNESRERSQTRPTSQSTPVDDEGSNHDAAQAEGSNDNESPGRIQTRPNSNNQSFARAAQTFETAVRYAWNRFELDRIRGDVSPPAPIVERGSTAIYHAPSILQFYFTNTPVGIHTESSTDHSSNHPAPSISNTQHSPGRDTHNPRKRKRSETDDDNGDQESQRLVDTVLSDHASDNRAPRNSNTQHSPGGITQSPRKRQRSEEDDEDKDLERQGPVDTVVALLEGRMLSRADRDALIAALDSAETQSDEGVEGDVEGDVDAQEDEEVSGDDEEEEEADTPREEEVLEGDDVAGEDEGELDDVGMQDDEGVSGDGEGPQNDAEIPSNEGGPGFVESQAYTEESSDGDTIVVRLSRNHQSRNQDGTEDVTRGRSLSRTGSRRQQRAGSSSSEEDLYGSSVSPRARNRPDTREDRDDQSVADDDANQSEGKGEDELSADDMHETPPRLHGRPTSGKTGRSSWSYQSSEEMTTVSATVNASNILGAVDGRRTSRQSHQNSVAASGPAEGAGHAVSAQRQVEERRASTRRTSNRASRAGSIVPRESPLRQLSVPRQEERGSSPQDSQADTRTPSRANRGVQDSPNKQRAALPSIPEERPMGRPHIPAPHNLEMTSKRKRRGGFDRTPAQPRSISPASRDEDLAAMGLETHSAQPDSEEEKEEKGDEGIMEEIPEEQSNDDGSEDDDAAAPGENTTQRHPEQIDSHPRKPESKNKKTDEPTKPPKLRLKVTNNPRVADHKKATEENEEEAVPSAGSEGNTSSLTSLTSGSEEEQPPVKRPKKRQKLRRRGRN
ncbi:hypothetical protein KC333_g6435 [Hortaea werneckii]|nr:hypothetical protein KC333_g6435 [Hortaea werneckii]KAI7310953.1 hypothetical protein KC326_g6486 [Hortaea werneckii]